MKRSIKKTNKTEATYNPWENPTIPPDAKVGIYARQSTRNQVKNNTVSAEMQTDELIVLVKQMGVIEGNIILYVENLREDGTVKSASGSLRIDQREGLQALVQRIEAGEIKAVIVFLEDRLFRDETQIQVNTFILICQEHNVLVITPFMTYDFRNPYHVKQFRWKCEQAADFLRDYIQHRLHAAKMHISSRGQYDGRAVSVGYIVDRREYVDGEKNPNYKKLTEYEAHATIVRRIFCRYVSIGGKAKKLYNELLALPVLFPAFDKDVDPRTVSRMLLREVPGGYHISFTGLLYLLTNVAYIGWWMHEGEYVKDNHPAIIEEDVFWYVFYNISDTQPDGTEHIRENRRIRYTQQGKPEAPALLKDIITTNEEKKAVYTGYRFTDWYYIIMWRNNTIEPVAAKYSVLVDHVDQAFKTALLQHMSNASDLASFRELTQKTKEQATQEKEKVQKDIARIERRMQATLKSLTEDPELPTATRTALHKIYADLDVQKTALLNAPPQHTPEQQLTTLLSYHDLLDRLEQEGDLYLDELQLLAKATTKRVTIDGLSPHFTLLTIQWRTPVWGTDTALLWRPSGRSPFWKEEERTIMQDNYTTMCPEDLLALLPQRSWHSITHQAAKMGLSRETHPSRADMMEHISLQDKTIMEQYELTQEELSSDKQIIWL